jgi:predicted component of type VI protein secretion system
MTKKDYQAFARIMHNAMPHDIVGQATERNLWLTIRDDMSQLFASDNPRFLRARFIEACETGTTRGMKS